MEKNWEGLIIPNFEKASSEYNKNALLQKFFATKLAEHCSQHIIPPGLWLDLGSGTGLLANALEGKNPHQSVLRVDASIKMLKQHAPNKLTKLFDLNLGLPLFKESPKLIASNFALHWLHKPEERLKEWFAALAPGGWLAIALPVKGSFPEWYEASNKANVNCTAMTFPSHDSLTKVINKEKIQLQLLENFTQDAPKVSALLKSLVQVGAQTSPYASLTIGEWRKVTKFWSTSQNNRFPKLTWLVQILLAQK